MADLTPDIRYILEREELDHLVRAVKEKGYKVMGPTLRNSAIVYDEVSSTSEFPAGWTDEQEAGSYRLVRRGDAALFGYAAGPHAWKRTLHPEMIRLWSAVRNGADFQLEVNASKPPKLALFGIRSCDLHAIFILDTVFQGGKIVDPAYAARRHNLLIIAVQCAEPGKTCFCASMNTGPESDRWIRPGADRNPEIRQALFCTPGWQQDGGGTHGCGPAPGGQRRECGAGRISRREPPLLAYRAR